MAKIPPIVMVEVFPPVVLSPDGGFREVTPANGIDFKLGELTAFINDGDIEVLYLGNGTLLVFDEDGKGKELPLNPVATGLAKSVIHDGDYIAGPALWCTEDQVL